MPRHGHWPQHIRPSKNYSSMSRQQRRRNAHMKEFAKIRREFGGSTNRGGYYYAEGMTRRIARAIARDRAKREKRA